MIATQQAILARLIDSRWCIMVARVRASLALLADAPRCVGRVHKMRTATKVQLLRVQQARAQ